MSNDIVLSKDEETGLVVLDLAPEDGDLGYENQTADDRKRVWLKQLQGSSAECKNRNRVEGAVPGDFYHTGTGRLFKDSVEIIICTTESCFVEWKPNGGGFVGRVAKGSAKWLEAKRNSEETGIFPWRLENGNILQDTRYLMVLCPGETDSAPWEFAVFSISSSKFSAYKTFMDRAWRSRIMNAAGEKIRTPLPLIRVKLSSFDDEGQNQEFSNLKMEAAVDDDISKSLLSPSDPRFLLGKEIAKKFNAGEVTIDYSSESHDEDEERPIF